MNADVNLNPSEFHRWAAAAAAAVDPTVALLEREERYMFVSVMMEGEVNRLVYVPHLFIGEHRVGCHGAWCRCVRFLPSP